MWARLLGLEKPEYAPNDLIFRLALAALFLLNGYPKFSSDPRSEWVPMFQQIGLGAWFRYLAGGVEMLAAILLLVPRLALVGLAHLAATMACATMIWIWVLHHPENAPITGFLLMVILAVGFVRWNEIRG